MDVPVYLSESLISSSKCNMFQPEEYFHRWSSKRNEVTGSRVMTHLFTVKSTSQDECLGEWWCYQYGSDLRFMGISNPVTQYDSLQLSKWTPVGRLMSIMTRKIHWWLNRTIPTKVNGQDFTEQERRPYTWRSKGSETPCQIITDLHEWRNNLSTVSEAVTMKSKWVCRCTR